MNLRTSFDPFQKQFQTGAMKNTGLIISAVILGIAVVGGIVVGKVRWDQSQRSPEMAQVEEIYKAYFAAPTPMGLPDLISRFFSAEFNEVFQENSRKCAETSGNEVCGLGSEDDFLLNAQEFDPKLDYENSKFRVLKFENGFIEANFNVYPSQLKAGKLDPAYDRRIRFFMKQENEKWVVDDMAYIGALGPVSIKEMMREEIGFLEKEK